MWFRFFLLFAWVLFSILCFFFLHFAHASLKKEHFCLDQSLYTCHSMAPLHEHNHQFKQRHIYLLYHLTPHIRFQTWRENVQTSLMVSKVTSADFILIVHFTKRHSKTAQLIELGTESMLKERLDLMRKYSVCTIAALIKTRIDQRGREATGQ